MPTGLICHAPLTQRSHTHSQRQRQRMCVFRHMWGLPAHSVGSPPARPYSFIGKPLRSRVKGRAVVEVKLRPKLLVRVYVRLENEDTSMSVFVCVCVCTYSTYLFHVHHQLLLCPSYVEI